MRRGGGGGSGGGGGGGGGGGHGGNQRGGAGAKYCRMQPVTLTGGGGGDEIDGRMSATTAPDGLHCRTYQRGGRAAQSTPPCDDDDSDSDGDGDGNGNGDDRINNQRRAPMAAGRPETAQGQRRQTPPRSPRPTIYVDDEDDLDDEEDDTPTGDVAHDGDVVVDVDELTGAAAGSSRATSGGGGGVVEPRSSERPTPANVQYQHRYQQHRQLQQTQQQQLQQHQRSSSPHLRASTPRSSCANFSPATSPVSPADEAETDKKDAKVRSGPSSRRTVLIIAGLFVVGLIFILSGTIVLSVEHHTAFRVAGGCFMGLGLLLFVICLILQKKNVKKLVNELEKDLYFLNVTDNKIWNMIFHFDEQLHWS